MRDLILIAAILAAWAYAYRWHRRYLRARGELVSLVKALLAAGVTEAEISRLVVPDMAAKGRAPFEILRVLRER